MLKNIQFNKIILVLFLIGMIVISGLGIFFLDSLNTLNEQIQQGQTVQIQEIQNKTIWVLEIAGVGFAIVGILAAILLSKYFIYPINKLIKSAEKITEEDRNVKRIFKNK